MKRSLEDFIDRTSAAGTLDELGALLRSELARDGFDNLVLATTRGRRLEGVIWADIPQAYVDAYLANGWDAIDPVLRRAQTAVRPFAWIDAAPPATLTAAQKRFFSECRDIGVHSGFTAPFHTPDGGVDLFSVSARGPAAPPLVRLPHLSALLAQSWMRYGELAERPPAAPPRLSRREVECLQWARDGKTNWQIGRILSIAEKTVEFHMASAMRKLGADNRIGSVIAAIRLGVIRL